jgi:hypothetical protein
MEGSNHEIQGVHFEEDKWRESLPSFEDEGPWIARFLVKSSGGAIKDQRTAEYVLFGLVVVIIVISVLLFIVGSSNNRPRSGEVPVGQIVP